MQPKIIFIKNITHEEGGLLTSLAESLKISFKVVDLHKGDPLPVASPGDAVVVLGGPDSANDRAPKILNEIDFLKRCVETNVPLLGICLGMQLLVKAKGGTVSRNSVSETGFRGPDGQWFEIELTEDGARDPFLQGLPPKFKVFQLHGETVNLTSGMTRLARGKFCENQIVKIAEKVYGIQGHVEMSETLLRNWMKVDGDLVALDSIRIRNDFSRVRTELESSAKKIFTNFLRISGFPR